MGFRGGGCAAEVLGRLLRDWSGLLVERGVSLGLAQQGALWDPPRNPCASWEGGLESPKLVSLGLKARLWLRPECPKEEASTPSDSSSVAGISSLASICTLRVIGRGVGA